MGPRAAASGTAARSRRVEPKTVGICTGSRRVEEEKRRHLFKYGIDYDGPRAAVSGENSPSPTPLLFEFFEVLMDAPAFPNCSQNTESEDA